MTRPRCYAISPANESSFFELDSESEGEDDQEQWYFHQLRLVDS